MSNGAKVGLVIVALVLLGSFGCCLLAMFGTPAAIVNWRGAVAPVDTTTQEEVVSNQTQPGPAEIEEQADEPKEVETGTCKELTTEKVKRLTGVDIQRVDTEPATWVWRAVDKANTPVTCPEGFICTFDLGGKVRVYVGPAETGIVAGTMRHVCEFPDGDAVYKPCALLVKEQAFGASETPSFEVAPGNFDCD